MRPCLELLPAPFLWRPALPVYHKELAAVLGVWRETVTAMLNRWCNEGLIAQRPGLIILKDVARLQHMAEDVP
jgi:hypothetical protein